MKVKVFRRADGLFDYHFVARNGRVMPFTTQGFRSRFEAWRSVDAFLVGVLDGVTREDIR